jgi:hypothetical protein
VTVAFLNQTPRLSHIVTLRVLLDLTDRAGDALIAAHEKLERDEAEVQRAEGPIEEPGHPQVGSP